MHNRGGRGRLTLRCTRSATAGCARFRPRVSSNVRPHEMKRSAPGLILTVAVALPFQAFAEAVTYEVREVSRIGSRLIAKGTREYSPSDIRVHPYERDGK